MRQSPSAPEFAAKKSAGEFFADGANITFDKALDLLIKRNISEGKSEAHRRRVKSVINAHLKPLFGKRKLNEFSAQRMCFVQEWMDDEAKHLGKAEQTLAHVKSACALAFDEAILKGHMGTPNPATEWLRVPKLNKKTRRELLTLEEISALVRGALCKAVEDKDELTWAARGMLALIALLASWRPAECTGLFWDCVDFDGRMLHMHRIWRLGGDIIRSSKTGESGMRSTPMSPILFAALWAYRERLQSMGRKTEGPVPVLVTTPGALFYPSSISAHHWPVLATKAGFMDADGGLKHSFYALRTTAANLWRTIGMQIDDVSGLMGHVRIDTTVGSYTRPTPHFSPIRREVEELMRRETVLERSPEGFIDALGFVLAQRWRAEGIEVGCAPPRSMTAQIGYTAQRALTPTMLELVPTVEPVPPPIIKSAEDFRVWQIEKTKQLFKIGWTMTRIAAELRVGFPTVKHWLRHADISHTRGKLPEDQRQDLMERVRAYREEHPEASTTDIAKALGVHAKRITSWERRRGRPMPHRPGAHKLGKHDAAIRRMLAEGRTCRQMAKILNGPSHSAIGYYINRLGLRDLRPVRNRRGVRIEIHATRIKQLAAAGKSKEAIARELAGELGHPSRSGIIGFIDRNGVKTTPGNPGQRIAKIKEAPEPR